MNGAARARLPNVVFEVTPRCNLSCRYCYAPWEAPTPLLAAPREIGFARAERTLDRLFRQADVGCVTMSGGEPLLAERLPELVLQCRLHGAAVNVITNGTVGSRDDYRQLLELGVSLFQLPLLSADAAVHDELVGVPGAWRRVIRSLGELRELGAGIVAAVILTRPTAPDLANTLQLIADLGLRRVMLNRFNPGGRGLASTLALTPEVDDLRRAFAVADESAARLDLTITSNVGLPHCLVPPDGYRRVRFISCTADPRRRPLALALDGGLRFCNHSPIVFGNLFDAPLTATLACDYLRRWQTTVPDACTGCARFPHCFGGCRAAAEQMGQTLAGADPLLAPNPARVAILGQGSGAPTSSGSPTRRCVPGRIDVLLQGQRPPRAV
ncbi:MAG: radical SAM protein [Candidatus Krumholzibacteriia bacterium]